MESAAVLRSFKYSVGTISNMRSTLERPGIVPVHNATCSKVPIQGLTIGWNLISPPTVTRKGTLLSCLRTTTENNAIAKSDVSSDSCPQGSLDKSSLRNTTFPSGFEALVLDVCDETQIAELKLKVGDFEMHLKRNIPTEVPLAAVSAVTSPPVPTKPTTESAPSAPAPSPPKTSTGKTNPFMNVHSEKSARLAALEASGGGGYVLVSSPTVGSFLKGRTFKGKKQPPSCKEGDLIKEGQVIGYLDQFGTELPVKSNVAGEVLKILFNDGEPVGYGDPLLAVLPSFHDIK